MIDMSTVDWAAIKAAATGIGAAIGYFSKITNWIAHLGQPNISFEQRKEIGRVSDQLLRGERVSSATLSLTFHPVLPNPTYAEIITLLQYESLERIARDVRPARRDVQSNVDVRGFIQKNPKEIKRMLRRALIIYIGMSVILVCSAALSEIWPVLSGGGFFFGTIGTLWMLLRYRHAFAAKACVAAERHPRAHPALCPDLALIGRLDASLKSPSIAASSGTNLATNGAATPAQAQPRLRRRRAENTPRNGAGPQTLM